MKPPTAQSYNGKDVSLEPLKDRVEGFPVVAHQCDHDSVIIRPKLLEHEDANIASQGNNDGSNGRQESKPCHYSRRIGFRDKYRIEVGSCVFSSM